MGKPLKIFGVKVRNEKKLLESQSGGAFSLIAEYFLNQGAIVYGVGQDSNLDAVYKRIDNLDDLILIKGSKYVQVEMGATYTAVKNDLASGKIVLFSGTPCYVQAMKYYVQNLKNSDNLFTVDLICHGVPSPEVYHQYLNYLECKMGAKIKTFIFRDKMFGGGWHEHMEKIIFENGREEYKDEYTQLFYTNLPLRPSCGNCHFSNMNRIGDFTVGDYWGVDKAFPDFDDKRGVSLVFCNSSRAVEIFEKLKMQVVLVEPDEASAALQPNLRQSSKIPRHSKTFWKDFQKNGIEYCIKKWSPIGGYPFRIKRKILTMLGLW